MTQELNLKDFIQSLRVDSVLGDKYSVTRLEAASEKALSYTMTPSFKNIQTILANGQDKLPKEEIKESSAPSEELGFIRGSEYYDRGEK